MKGTSEGVALGFRGASLIEPSGNPQPTLNQPSGNPQATLRQPPLKGEQMMAKKNVTILFKTQPIFD